MKIEVEMILESPDAFPFFYEQVAEGEEEDGTPFRIGISMADGTIYLFTERPHPDSPKRRAMYLVRGRELYEAMLKALPKASCRALEEGE